jgi:DNA modification methylase
LNTELTLPNFPRKLRAMSSLTLKPTRKAETACYNKPAKLGIKNKITSSPAPRSDSNRLELADRPAHDWYRFILSYPPHLVRQYIERFGLGDNASVLDPFCGTGTTIVECQKLGLRGVGIEAHPMAYFASATKIDWSPDPDQLELAAAGIAERTLSALEREGIIDDPEPYLLRESPPTAQFRHLSTDAMKLLLADSISPLPLHKTLVLLEAIDASPRFGAHFRLALARALVTTISNLHFGPEVGVGPAKEDAPVVSTWLARVCQMAHDIRLLKSLPRVSARIFQADARTAPNLIEPASIDAVITSPPYPNEKDYTRTTRLESVILGFFRDRATLRELKRTMLRSNTRGVYKGDDDDRWVTQFPEIERIAAEIERRRIEMGKTSGFERLYARVTKLYFGGMARHFAELRPLLRPGARLAYVVGDQASYLRVMIRTGQLLGTIAEQLGYEVTNLDLFRTRLATATREQLREEVLVLRWPGTK